MHCAPRTATNVDYLSTVGLKMKAQSEIKNIVILGAGAIGCFVGASWAHALLEANIKVTLIGRKATFKFGGADHLVCSDNDETMVDVKHFEIATDAEALKHADVILLAMKSTGLERAIEQIKTHSVSQTPIISLLNGLEPARQLRAALPDHSVVSGMVPFNVVWKSGNHLHKSSAGNLSLETSEISKLLAARVSATQVPIDLYEDLKPIQYGKLLLNLINPINALSGLALHKMLSQRQFRQIYAATLSEALNVYDAASIQWKKVGPISPKLGAKLLPSPNFFFNNTLLKLQKIDKTSITSMATDLINEKPTEIEVINGEIVRLAKEANTLAPINLKLMELIGKAEKQQEFEPLSSKQLARALGVFQLN